jgi:hypothetical protein
VTIIIAASLLVASGRLIVLKRQAFAAREKISSEQSVENGNFPV